MTTLTTWNWTPERIKAAELCALGGRTRQQIATEVGITIRQLARWKEGIEFQQRVDERIKEWQQKVKNSGIAVKENRIARLNRRVRLMEQVISERAADPKNQEVAGGSTGLLVYHKVSIGIGKLNKIQDEWEVDTGLLKELREHEEQTAREMGQRTEKHEVTGPGGGPIPLVAMRLADALTLEELQAIKQRMLESAAV
jgi:hypothetical protein